MIHCASEINSLKRGEFALCGKKQVFVKTPDAVYAQAVWIRFAVRVAVASELAQWRVCWLRAPFSTWRVSAWAPVSALWHALHLLLVCWCTKAIYPTFAKIGLCGCQCGDKNLVFSLQMNHSRRRHTSIRRPKKKKPKTNKVSFDIWIILFPPFLSYNRLYTSFSTKFFNGHDARYVTDATPRRGAAFHNSLLFLI